MKIWVCGITTPTGAMSAEDDLRRAGYDVVMPMHSRWVRHARQLKVASRPLLGRYIFIEVDTSLPDDLGPIYAARSIESVLGRVPTKDVKRLRWEYIRGDFDEVTNGKLPVGARVMIVAGEWEARLAVITGISKSGAATLKVSGVRSPVNLSANSLRPA
jgi:transcription antitermination factor NusG